MTHRSAALKATLPVADGAAVPPSDPAKAIQATPKAPKAKIPKVRKPNVRSTNQREQIIQAAFACFSGHGYDNASTRMIATLANASHSKVLYHFGSKKELWIATMDHAVQIYINRMERDIASPGNRSASERLRVFIKDFVEFSAEYPGVHRILSMESTQGTDRLGWLIDRHLRAHFTTICNLIRLGQNEGSVRDGDPARLYYHIISAGAAPFTLSSEYSALTGRDVYSKAEIFQTIGFIYSVIFVND